MLQKPKITPPMRAPMAATDATLSGTIGQLQRSRAVQSLQNIIGLPDSWASFLMFLVVLIVLSGGLLLHIHLSAQLLQIQLQIDSLARAHDEIEYQNAEIIWQISQSTAIHEAQQRALALGYDSTQQHYYVTTGNGTDEATATTPDGSDTHVSPFAVESPAESPAAPAATGHGNAHPTLLDASTTWQSRLQDIGRRIQRLWLR